MASLFAELSPEQGGTPLPAATEPVSPRRLGLPEKPKGAWDPSSPEPDTATYLGLAGIKSRTQTPVRQERGLGGKVKGGAHTLGISVASLKSQPCQGQIIQFSSVQSLSRVQLFATP